MAKYKYEYNVRVESTLVKTEQARFAMTYCSDNIHDSGDMIVISDEDYLSDARDLTYCNLGKASEKVHINTVTVLSRSLCESYREKKKVKVLFPAREVEIETTGHLTFGGVFDINSDEVKRALSMAYNLDEPSPCYYVKEIKNG